MGTWEFDTGATDMVGISAAEGLSAKGVLSAEVSSGGVLDAGVLVVGVIAAEELSTRGAIPAGVLATRLLGSGVLAAEGLSPATTIELAGLIEGLFTVVGLVSAIGLDLAIALVVGALPVGEASGSVVGVALVEACNVDVGCVVTIAAVGLIVTPRPDTDTSVCAGAAQDSAGSLYNTPTSMVGVPWKVPITQLPILMFSYVFKSSMR